MSTLTAEKLGTFSDALFCLENHGVAKDLASQIATTLFQLGVSAAVDLMRPTRPTPVDAPQVEAQLTLIETSTPGSAPRRKKRKKSEPAKGLHRIPADLELTDDMRCFAAERAFPAPAINAMWLKFTNHYRANGQTAVDWKAKWRTWVMKTVEFNTRDGRTPGGNDTTGGGFL